MSDLLLVQMSEVCPSRSARVGEVPRPRNWRSSQNTYIRAFVNKDEKGRRGQEVVRECARRRRPRSGCGAFPAPRIPLELSGDGGDGDSGAGAHAVGNACDALGRLGGDSVSCACYTFDGC
jgi:hypothetical protein